VLFGLLQAFSLNAMADIYLNAEPTDEISLSNIDSGEYYEVIVADDRPSQPSSNTASGNQTPVSSPLTHDMPFADAVQAASRENMLDPALIQAVIATESKHNPNAISPRGAQGLMQLMPATSKRLGLRNPYDPVQNIRAGSRYLRELKDMFNGDIRLMLAAYNAGPGSVIRYGMRIPPFEETRRYVPSVLRLYQKISRDI
jgi:soluble lytic murein transglycosylase-like protein